MVNKPLLRPAISGGRWCKTEPTENSVYICIVYSYNIRIWVNLNTFFFFKNQDDVPDIKRIEFPYLFTTPFEGEVR